MLTGCVLLFGIFLSYANGANDNFKGVASLYGSGATTYKKALYFATAAQIFGSLAALILAQGLLAAFTGKGLVPDSVVQLQSFRLAVGLGAALTVMLATRFGYPISTTHALTGALVGAGLLASKDGVQFSKLGTTFFIPLVLSPILAVAFAFILYFVVRKLFGANDRRERPIVRGIHYLSGGSVCFARALNDTPKIAATLLIRNALFPGLAISIVAVAMAIGGLINSRKLAETMAHKITVMNEDQGLSANLITSILVIFASKLGVPVSTTHVSVGALFGVGFVTKQARVKTMLNILLAWVTTLPAAAILSSLLFLIMSHLN